MMQIKLDENNNIIEYCLEGTKQEGHIEVEMTNDVILNNLFNYKYENGNFIQKKSEKELKEDIEKTNLRELRNLECFKIINRGTLWHENLTNVEKEELKSWYKEWLDVTDTKEIPQKPEWL